MPWLLFPYQAPGSEVAQRFGAVRLEGRTGLGV